jgi:hypothetical protein
MTQVVFCQALMALHEGDLETAAALTGADRPVRDSAPLALVATLASALADPPDPAQGQAALDRLSLTRGGGRPLPLAVLQAFVARGDSAAPLRSEDLEADLTALQEAAASDLLCLYTVPWAEALAALALREAAPGRAADLWSRAASRPGAGPWLERLARVTGGTGPGS